MKSKLQSASRQFYREYRLDVNSHFSYNTVKQQYTLPHLECNYIFVEIKGPKHKCISRPNAGGT